MNRRTFLHSGGMFLLASTSLSSIPAYSDSLSIEQKHGFAQIYGVENNLLTILQKRQDERAAVPISPRLFAIEPILDAVTAETTDKELWLVTVEACHKLALDLTAIDHNTTTSVSVPDIDIYGEQLGPARSSWALGLVHLAMFEAMNVFRNDYVSYKQPGSNTEIREEIIRESHLGTNDIVIKVGTLASAAFHSVVMIVKTLYPKKRAFIAARADEIFKTSVKGEQGIAIGKAIGEATALIVLRARGWSDAYGFTDGSEFPEPAADDFKTADIRKWHIDPISKIPVALGGMWSRVKTFVIPQAESFRCDPPPDLTSDRFISAFKEVKTLGAWGKKVSADPSTGRFATETTREGEVDPEPGADGKIDYKNNQSLKAVFWGYDGTAFLCAPPRLYNALAMTIARTKLKFIDPYELSRFLAIVNLSMADAGISAWEAKYYYLFPRPITYIRNVDADSSPEGKGESTWTPLGAAVTNAGRMGRNVTPPFPAYPSGHAVFGGAVCEVLRRFLIASSTADASFKFISDEYNHENYSPGSVVPRPLVEVEFPDQAAVEEENGMSRIWMGIHWEFDKTNGKKQGNNIATYVMDEVFLRR
ncbi:vanadium-dependent haloperoxidase [Mesorhizobium sp. M0663]|uniref:vanadium-dependent haloperoxidase n=1 Tax=unclassified Mesorhizobium TaxID=325217 RepID=UPI00333D8D79